MKERKKFNNILRFWIRLFDESFILESQMKYIKIHFKK